MSGAQGFRRTMRHGIAWLGLLLMASSFAWLVLVPRPERTITREKRPVTAEPFSLVVLDPGHGGHDSGAMCGEIMEKDLTFDIARRLDRLLQGHGLATLMTRVGDSYISVAERAALANRSRDCVLVSIHFNEGSKPVSSGIETYYAAHQRGAEPPLLAWLPFLQRVSAPSPNADSQSLAGFIQEELVVRTKAVNRGTKSQQFFVIANVRHPAVLVEGGFLSNKEDLARLVSDDYREQIATAISDGIMHYREVLKQRQLETNGGTLAAE